MCNCIIVVGSSRVYYSDIMHTSITVMTQQVYTKIHCSQKQKIYWEEDSFEISIMLIQKILHIDDC